MFRKTQGGQRPPLAIIFSWESEAGARRPLIAHNIRRDYQAEHNADQYADGDVEIPPDGLITACAHKNSSSCTWWLTVLWLDNGSRWQG